MTESEMANPKINDYASLEPTAGESTQLNENIISTKSVKR
jgi:hypothetical protein